MTQREVTLEGGAPWGFRMNGGVDQKYPLKVSRVNPGSKAAQRGVREGDLITSIQGEKTRNLTNSESHNLLKKSGSTLKLGLNEDLENSPTRRQYRTIHQETHQETVKKSSVTYTLKETIQRSSSRQKEKDNECETLKSTEYINGKDTHENGTNVTLVTNIPVTEKSTSSSSNSTPSTLIPEGRNISSDHALASRQSSYSNCSSIPDEGLQQETRLDRSTDNQDMNDGQGRMSKSKKRRQRRKNLLNRTLSQDSQSQSEAEIDEIDSNTIRGKPEDNNEIVLEPSSKNLEILRLKRIEHKYKVESPKELKLEHARDVKKLKAKSKSLDDDDLLKIQELSEASESEDAKYQPNVVISEASSEENLLDDLDSQSQRARRSALSSMCLQVNEDNKIEATSKISPKEEQELRSFLGGLNLANSPEESAKDLYERTTGLGDSKAKKLQKRKQLEEYFMPIAENPRYLDAISEEASDISDKEGAGSSKSAQHIKQGTPEQDSVPPVTIESCTNRSIPILVETKVLDQTNGHQEGICTTEVVAVEEQRPEVVYLLDSSTSSISTEDFDDALDNISEECEGTIEDKVQSTLDDDLDKEENFPLQGNLELSQEIGKNEQKENTKDERSAKENVNDLGLQIDSSESYSTIISSNTDTCKRVSAPLNYPSINYSSQTPAPKALYRVEGQKLNLHEPQTSFDYTKSPNVLKQKEPETVKANPKSHPKESIASKLNEKIENGIDKYGKCFKIDRSEAKSTSALHTSNKLVNGLLQNAEYRKVKVDELSRNGDVEVVKDFEQYVLKPNETIENKIKDISSNPLKDGLKTASQSIDKDPVGEEDRKKVIVSSSTKSSSTIKSENSISESKKEFVLKHVIMNSQDSNKTDSQKLVEYEKIKKLNNEIKDKISKKELIGPSCKKSKLPAVELIGVTDNGHDVIVMNCEHPSKNFVEKRVTEFSAKDFNSEKSISESTRNNRLVENTPIRGNDLIKSRIERFSNKWEDEDLGNTKNHESILQSRNKIANTGEKETKRKLINEINKESGTKSMNGEKLNEIKLENIYENVPKKEQGSVLQHLLRSDIDGSCKAPNSTKVEDKKELIIPIKLEVNNCKIAEENTKKKLNNERNKASCTKSSNGEILQQIESENIYANVSQKVPDGALKNLLSSDVKSKKEIIIPVTIEHVQGGPCTQNSKKVKDILSNTENSTLGKNYVIDVEKNSEHNIPIVVEKYSRNNKLSTFNKEDIQSLSKTLESIAEKKTLNKKTGAGVTSKNPSERHNDTSPPIPPLPKENALAFAAQLENISVPPVPPPRRSKAPSLSTGNARKLEPDVPLKGETLVINSDVLSPLGPASGSSESSESEESSRCTVKYNPNSSLADVASIAKDEEMLEDKKNYEPLPLRDIVLRVLVCLPFGEEILKELAEVSKSIEHFTNKLPFKGRISENDNVSVENNPDMWTSRSDSYEEEHKKILELHKNFAARRRHDEGPNHATKSNNDDRVIITNIGKREEEVLSPNRLLTIIREEPSETEPTQEFKFFADNSEQRLKAKNLGEWLTLARHKSKSTSNLDCTNIPINNLRRTIQSVQSEQAKFSNTRRRSLPQEIYEKQLIDIMEKEREIQRELEMLEEEKRKLRAEIAPSRKKEFQVDDFYVSKKGDFAEMREDISHRQERPASMPVFPTEFFRQQMYEEYMDKFSERQERKQQKVIKISSSNDLEQEKDVLLKSKEIIHPIEIEQEFMDRVKAKLQKNSSTPDSEKTKDEVDEVESSKINENDDATPVIVLDRDKVKGVEALPRHLQEFVDDLTTQQEESIWSPGQPRRPPSPPGKQYQRTNSQNSQTQNEPVLPIWTPKSANSSPVVERKEFRPVNFQSPVLGRKNRTRSETIPTPDSTTSEPPWKVPEGSSDTALHLSSTLDRRLPTSQSSPGFGSFPTSPRLPRAQNPTITLLQKAREGQLPRGAQYLDQDRKLPNDRPPIKYPGEVLYHIKNEYTSESDSERPRKMADLAPRKFEGIGPTTKDGMPLILRSEVKNEDQSKWYKRMYDTIHKQKPHRDEYVTIRYKQKRAQYPYSSGYLSEPEPGAYDSDFTEYKYQTLDRRRTPQTQHYISNNSTMPRNVPEKSHSSSDIIRNTHEKYNNQPGRIENYRPGHSSISEKEAKQWWDEVMDIFDGHLEQQSRVPQQKPRSFINQALKESGYESDSTLVFKRKEETAANQLSPKDQREVYKMIQKGGDVPFQGLRKPAPERPKEPDLPPPPPPPKSQGAVRSQEQESPRKYVENEVTIHYKTPIRSEVKDYVSEDELAHRQAEAMKKIYEEERKRKYFQVSNDLQELQDMKSRRHTDNFIPSQKSPIPLNRYDDFDDLTTPTKTRTKSPEPRLLAKALYNFVGQTARELTFRKGELIYVRRQIDKNWYEGELNAMVGLFPVNYVEIVPSEVTTKICSITPRKAHEGQARAKYNFVAQTHLELSLAKGELVTITRKVDDNWFEGKIGGRKGIFPVSYVDVLIDPSEPPPPSTKPVASPAAHSLLLNGSSQGKESMGSHLYTPNVPNPITSRDNGYHHAKPVQISGIGTYSTLPKTNKSPMSQALHIETQSDPIPYRALYKYTPQNDDELELLEGDTVYVLEKCDDGWYVGSSHRTGAFGTFPGNYVEKI